MVRNVFGINPLKAGIMKQNLISEMQRIANCFLIIKPFEDKGRH